MKVINVINAKGGIGKTTTSINIAVGFADKGYRVLIIDSDAQGDATDDLLESNEKHDELRDLNGVLLGLFMIEDCIYQTDIENLEILPSFDMELVNTDKAIFSSINRESKLKKQLRRVKDKYDYVIIDNATAFNTVTLNTLNCGTDVIIPLNAKSKALNGLKITVKQLEDLGDPEMLDIEYNYHILPNLIHRGRVSGRKFIENLKSEYGDKVLDTFIGYQDAVIDRVEKENKMLIRDVRKFNKTASDYRELVEELKNEML